jgi:hypothetical protein
MRKNIPVIGFLSIIFENEIRCNIPAIAVAAAAA